MHGETFYTVLTRAVRDITEHGFDSQGRLETWLQSLQRLAEKTLTPQWKMEEQLRNAFSTIYRRLIDRGEIAKYHPGVSRFTIQKIAPRLRSELDRRIMASASLIKMNRQASIQKTLQRFAGWASSIPAGGSDATDKGETKDEIRKALAQLPFEERRVLIDQGHKFTASLSEIIAKDSGALAMVWHSHWRQAGYNYREDHKERDGKVFVLKGNWALEAGLMKIGPDGYYEDVDGVGQAVFCRCFGTWLHSLRELPDDLLTEKGRSELSRVRAKAG